MGKGGKRKRGKEEKGEGTQGRKGKGERKEEGKKSWEGGREEPVKSENKKKPRARKVASPPCMSQRYRSEQSTNAVHHADIPPSLY